MLQRIKIDPQVCGGRPTIRGLRFTVDFVLKLIGDGYHAEDIVRLYPEWEIEDIYDAAKYGAWLASERAHFRARVKLLADVHISPDTVAFLNTLGYDTVRVSEALSPSATDSLITEHAFKEDRTVLTQDLDF